MSAPWIGPAELEAGARELATGCLAISEADRVLVLTDAATAPLAEYLERASAALAPTRLLVLPSLDDAYDEAFARIEAGIVEDRPSVVLFAARDADDRLAWDGRYWELLDGIGARSAQLPALDAPSLGIGLATDYAEVARFTEAVTSCVAGVRRVRVANALGTDIVFDCDPARPWTPFTGIYRRPGEGGRLPQGETFCSPVNANGTIAASVIGYPFNAATGLLAEPARFEISGGRLVGLSHPDPVLAERLTAWFERDEHAARIGELAFGTNRACTALTGNLLFDENVPGCHIAIGHPFGDYTGAEWESGVHVDLVVDRPTIHVDDRLLIERGAYADPELD
ncbi:aminopeptidase [Leucobacter iarius]|uniref:aminopeptidase n=1 Tax=Leucobacter iarius TaxID=333963 RepID=UPI0031CE7FC0